MFGTGIRPGSQGTWVQEAPGGTPEGDLPRDLTARGFMLVRTPVLVFDASMRHRRPPSCLYGVDTTQQGQHTWPYQIRHVLSFVLACPRHVSPAATYKDGCTYDWRTKDWDAI